MKYSTGNYSVSSSTTTSVKTSQTLSQTFHGTTGTLKVWGET